MKRWYAVYTQPRREALAREHLDRQGFEVLAPIYLKRCRHARKVEDVPAPLFPRYIFVKFDIDDPAWRVVRSTRGVVDLVRRGADPAAVPDSVVDNILARTDDNGLVSVARNAGLIHGAKIRIEAGPFADYEAIFQATSDNERIVVLLSLLGRSVKTQVPIDIVTPLSP